jgi:flagellar biosynthetic protein FliR
MLTFTEAQVAGWMAPLLWPFLRALALFSAMPILGTRMVPVRVRVGLAALIALAMQVTLPPLPESALALDSAQTLPLVAQQVLIGLTLGFAVRLAFAAVEFAGELIGLQMGLNFAGFFDPISAGTSTPSARFFGTTVAWLFIVINGHLVVIAALAQSFVAFPVGPEPFAFLHAWRPERWGSEIFAIGLSIALPLVTMLLFVNLVLGAVSRVAPQINIFSIGFPITLVVGLLGLVATLPALNGPLTQVLERVLMPLR